MRDPHCEKLSDPPSSDVRLLGIVARGDATRDSDAVVYCKDCGKRKMHGRFVPRTHAATFSGISLRRNQLVLGRCIIGRT